MDNICYNITSIENFLYPLFIIRILTNSFPLKIVNKITKRRYSIKQSKRCRKKCGDGYKSGGHSFALVDNNEDICNLCGCTDETGVLIIVLNF